MSDQFWLTKAQLKRIESHFPKSRGVPRVDDRRVVSGIIPCLAAEGGPPDLLMIDSTHLKVHRTAASLLKGGDSPRCIGRTKGGLNSKLHAVCDGTGRPIILLLTEGQMSDHKGVSLIFYALPDAGHLPLHPASGKAPLTGAPLQNPV